MRKFPIVIILALFVLVLVSISSNAASVEFTVKASGNQTSIFQNQTQQENCAFNNETNSTECTNQTYVVNTTIVEPWEKTITLDIECSEVCSYPMPSFNAPPDVKIAKYSLSTMPQVNIYFDSTKSRTTYNPEDRIIVEFQAEKIAELILDRILPSTFEEGAFQVNVFVVNNGTDSVNSFNLSIIGAGLTAYAESYGKLEPSGMAIVPIMLNATAGQKDIIVKLSWTSNKKVYSAIYPYRITVLASKNDSNAVETKQVNSTEVVERFNSDKDRLRNYESDYSTKKSEGYLVSEVYDSIKNAKDYVAAIQLLVEEEKFSDAKLKLALLELTLDDIGNGLQNALKTKQTLGEKLRNNALIISAVITAIVASIGFYERQKLKMRQLKEKLARKKLEKQGNIMDKKPPAKKKPDKKIKTPPEEEQAPPDGQEISSS